MRTSGSRRCIFIFNQLLENAKKKIDDKQQVKVICINHKVHTQRQYTLYISSDFNSYSLEVDDEIQAHQWVNFVNQKRCDPASCTMIFDDNELTVNIKNIDKIMNLILFVTPTKVGSVYGF